MQRMFYLNNFFSFSLLFFYFNNKKLYLKLIIIIDVHTYKWVRFCNPFSKTLIGNLKFYKTFIVSFYCLLFSYTALYYIFMFYCIAQRIFRNGTRSYLGGGNQLIKFFLFLWENFIYFLNSFFKWIVFERWCTTVFSVIFVLVYHLRLHQLWN